MRPRREHAGHASALPVMATLLVLAALLAGCGHVNRSATLGSYATNATVSGATVAAALEQHLAAEGLPGAKVLCVRRVIIDVGATMGCALRGAGTRSMVVFRFRTASGAIDTGSIKAP